ncbi:hypothetical protein CEXT_83891 [Caerostris extrusa]|uniref:Uncharacterized protein n=1 Tax=Caerostris extrusa TaxID=172846 RepID=A0AAV4QYL4_CAEEX|nr:hypothetical protein CEXT_83891 [Caerostris extrusa]
MVEEDKAVTSVDFAEDDSVQPLSGGGDARNQVLFPPFRSAVPIEGPNGHHKSRRPFWGRRGPVGSTSGAVIYSVCEMHMQSGMAFLCNR